VLGFARLLAHASFPAPVAFTSEGLFLAGMGTAVGAYWVAHHREGTSGKVATVGLGLAAVGCCSFERVHRRPVVRPEQSNKFRWCA